MIGLNHYLQTIIPMTISVFILTTSHCHCNQVMDNSNSRPGNDGHSSSSAALHADPRLPPHEHLQQQPLPPFRQGMGPPFNGPMNPGMMAIGPGMAMSPYGPPGGVGMGAPGMGTGCKVRCDRICDPQNLYQGCQTRCFRECCSIEPMMMGPGPGIGGGVNGFNGGGRPFNGQQPPSMYGPMKSKSQFK